MTQSAYPVIRSIRTGTTTMGPQLKRTSKCVRLILLANCQIRPYHVFVSLDAKVVDFLLCLADLVDVGAAIKSNVIGNFLIS